MPASSDPLFDQFIAQRSVDLRRIARHTQDECSYGDVVNTIWILACDLRARRNLAIDFLDPEAQELLLRHAYQQLVRYTERNVRYAVRLDHSAKDDDEEGRSHPLMRLLVSDGGKDPLATLIEQEEQAGEQAVALDAHHSQESAYVSLLGHFENRMSAVARHLLISISYAYRRYAHARLLTAHQHPMPLSGAHPGFIPGPWRRFRLQHKPLQLAFDFDAELPL